MTTAWQVYEEKLRPSIERIVRDRSQIDDLLQDAFLNCWRLWRSKPLSDQLKLMRSSAIRSHFRALKRHSKVRSRFLDTELLVDESEPNKSPEFKQLKAEEAEEVQRCIADLPSDYRQIVFLRFYCDLTLEQIAFQTGKKLNTAKTRLRRALKRLGFLLLGFHSN